MTEVSEALNQEFKGDTKKLVDGVWKKLEQTKDREKISEERKNNQKKVLENLDSIFAVDLKGYISLVGKDQGGKIAGFVFEELVRADEEICRKKETPLAETLRSVMNQPKRYQLEKLGIEISERTPDLAMINEEGEITGWVEAKAGRLGRRQLKQLENFLDSFSYIISQLKTKEEKLLKEHGLKVIAENKDKLILRGENELERVLAVPNGSYTTQYKTSVDNLIERSEDRETRRALEDVIGSYYKVKESPFSKDELRIITDTVIELSESGGKV